MPAIVAAAGGVSPRVQLSNQTIDDVVTQPATAEAQYRVESDGEVRSITEGNGNEFLETWGTNPNLAYEVRASIVSGSLSGGSDVTGAWLALSTDRRWRVLYEGSGAKTCTLTVEIRLGTTVLATATINLSAESTP